MSSIGERIRLLRLEKGWTQEVLADLLGVSRLAVARWETGERKPRKKYLDKLAEVLGVSKEELLGVEKQEESKLKIIKASQIKANPLAVKLVQDLFHSRGIPFRETSTTKKLISLAENKLESLKAELDILLDIMQQLPEDSLDSDGREEKS
jgi:transcriptional regulator with XRE-family HTH domain